MINSEKLLKLLSSMVENGILTSQDVKKEIINILKFNKENIIHKMKLVPREEFEVLKKVVLKQNKEIEKLKKIKRATKAKKP
jgi:BMFP domain-containing protein YqiC|tara:strand:- start:86 stop:331 length:246 start_codon:yes stop_codon:yes gene_type:complete